MQLSRISIESLITMRLEFSSLFQFIIKKQPFCVRCLRTCSFTSRWKELQKHFSVRAYIFKIIWTLISIIMLGSEGSWKIKVIFVTPGNNTEPITWRRWITVSLLYPTIVCISSKPTNIKKDVSSGVVKFNCNEDQCLTIRDVHEDMSRDDHIQL